MERMGRVGQWPLPCSVPLLCCGFTGGTQEPPCGDGHRALQSQGEEGTLSFPAAALSRCPCLGCPVPPKRPRRTQPVNGVGSWGQGQMALSPI